MKALCGAVGVAVVRLEEAAWRFLAALCDGEPLLWQPHPSTTITGARRPGQTHSLAPTGWLIADPACRPVFIFGTGVRSGALHGACDRFTFPSECRIASIGPHHAMILPHDANPGRMEFSERTGALRARGIPAHASDGLDVNGLNCCARASSSACSIKKPVRPPLSSSASSKAASRCPISSPRFCAESIISDLHPFSAC